MHLGTIGAGLKVEHFPTFKRWLGSLCCCGCSLWLVGLCRTGSPGRALVFGSRALPWLRAPRADAPRAALAGAPGLREASRASPERSVAERAQGRRTVRGRRRVYSSLGSRLSCLRAFERGAGARVTERSEHLVKAPSYLWFFIRACGGGASSAKVRSRMSAAPSLGIPDAPG